MRCGGYKYSSTDINYTNKTLTVEFDIVDKYFFSTTLSATNAVNNITVKMIDINAVPANITKTLKKKTISADQTSGSITYKANGDIYENSRKIGERYTLVISGLEQASKSADGKYKDYSGPMSVAFPAGVITDTSGNTSDQITITVGIDEPDKSGMQEIVDVVTPIWEAKSTTIDKWNKRAIIQLQGTDKYYASNSLDTSKITVYVDGKEITNIEKTLSESTPLTETRNGQEMQYGVEYTLTLSGFSEPDSEFMTARKNGSREYREYSGKTEVKIAAGTLSDAHNTNKEQTISLGNVDCLKPDIIYETSNTTIDQGNKILTVVFEVTDKYYNASASSLKLSDLTVTVDEKTMTSAELTASGNSLTATALASGKGTKYTLVIKNLQQNPNDGVDYSGIVSIAIPSGKFADTTGNTNDAKTITIGVDTPTNDENHNTGTIVDVVSPVWKAENFRASSDNTQILVDLVGTDKYLDTSKTSVDPSKIKVVINNQDIEATAGIAVNKSIEYKGTRSDILTGAKDVIYTLTLSNFKESDETFLAARAAGTRLYREYSGFTQIEMPAGQLKDTSNNTNVKTTLDLGNIDRIPPEVVKVSSTVDKTNKKETIVFDIVDKYLKTSTLGTTTTEANNNLSKLHVFVDDEAADNITKKITKVEKLTDTIGTTTNQLIGYRYTLELTNFEKSKNSKGVKDWSGTVRVDVDAAVAIDTNGNTSDETSIECDFVDLIKPYLEYTHQSSDISTTNKTYTMKFRITDKYYKSGKLTLNDLTVKIKNGQLKNGSEIVYNLSDLAKAGTVTLALRDTEIYANDIYITDETTGEIDVTDKKLIGHEYTLKMSNLEKLQIADGMTTADYSGIISVGIAANKVLDRTYNGSNNGNTASTITSGVNIPNGSGNGTVVDVVDPLITGVSTVADPTKGTATLTFRATDSYFASSSISAANIQIYVNGIQKAVGVASGDGITKTLSQTSKTESRLQNGTTSNVQYGIEYTLNITGYPANINQLRVVIPAGLVADQSGNHNKEKSFNLFNTLATAESSPSETSAFMGNTYGIQRGKIAQIVFESYIGGTSSTRWDVSAQKDQSIMAWYNANEKPTSDTYIIHIGSETLIGANVNSSNWFSYIGYDANCKATSEESDPIIKNLKIISVANVTNMSNMFAYLGYSNMTTFSLSSNFYTTSATNMSGMFKYAGFTKMTTINLGSNFNTSKVTNMNAMFNHTGYTAMTGLNLGSAFYTSKVTNMGSMFGETGYTAMTSLNLGTNFDTSAVTSMSWMFSNCGHDKMTSLTLGANFNTSLVTTMQGMFNGTGNKLLTSLDLGDLFYTTNVENMTNMFSNCGTGAMTSLDLGPAFTRIADTRTNMFYNTGKSGNVVYASEQIYLDKNNFKLNTSVTTSAINYTRGTINPRYRTEWIKQSSQITIDSANPKNSKITITLRGRTNAEAGKEFTSNVTSSLTQSQINDQIKVFIDGKEATTITKTIGNATADTNATTGASDVVQVLTITNFQEAARQSGKSYKEWSGNISLKIAKKTLTDTKYSNQNLSAIDTTGTMTDIVLAGTGTEKQNDTTSTSTMFTDFVKPEFNYLSSETTINHDTKTVTILFSVRDKYFSNSGLTADTTASKISVTVADEEINSKITKKLEVVEEEKDTVNGKNKKVGEKYRLTITGLDHKDGTHYSGIMQLGFAKDLVADFSGNKNDSQTITIGVDTPNGTGSGTIVDVVSPVWSIASTNAITGVIKLRVTDKYLVKADSIFALTKDSIKVIVNGVESTTIEKSLSGPTEITANQVYEYTLTLSNIEPSDGGYTEFTPIDPIVGGTAKYRNENGGDVKLRIVAGTVTDKYGNKTLQQDLVVGSLDNTKPEVYYVQTTRDNTNHKATIVFNVTDKNYYSSKIIGTDEMSIWMDATQIDSNITKTITKKVEIKTTIDNKTKVVGHQYTLEINKLRETDQTFINSARSYREYSGTLQVKINPTAARDIKGNTINQNTATLSSFVDTLKPEVVYKYSSSDINKENKTFSMTFDIVDKYYNSASSSAISISDLAIRIDGKEPDWSKVTRTLTPTGGDDITATNISYTDNGTIKTGNKVVGKRYTLTLSNLEQLQTKDISGNYIEYSGVVSVVIPQNKVADIGTTGDKTNLNKNSTTTITSGISLPGGSGNDQVVDVVDPLVEKITSSASAVNKTASVNFKITDKYFAKSTLTQNNIKVLVNGTEVTGKITGFTSKELKEDRTSGSTTTQFQYGVEYTVNVGGFDSNVNQVIVRIPQGVVTDTSANGNKQTDLVLYNVLKKTDTESAITSVFLGGKIQRQNIYNITFEKVIPNSVYNHATKKISDTTRAWDVSAQGDQSIVAWYVDSEIKNSTYKIHIATNSQVPGQTTVGNNEIFANVNSSRLFQNIGYSTNCTATEVITNLNLLDTASVTDMRWMFQYTGYNAMKKLDLSSLDTRNVTLMSAMFYGTGYKAMDTLTFGTNFNTSKVTTMEYMFYETGYTAMQTLNLGSNFNTSKVTNMQYMFRDCGHDALTALDLGSNFDTSKVKDMQYMFYRTGYRSMTSLDLGTKFNTINVTNMSYMFFETGPGKLSSINLGTEFDTRNVTDMSHMFHNTGNGALKNLDLGDKFYTTNVTNMNVMFYGTHSLKTLDLGPAFTKIASQHDSMFDGTTVNTTIYASEQIYLDKNNFKLDTDETSSAINYTRGTINPKYRTEWVKESSSISTANKNITITLRGRTNSEAGVDFTSNVTSLLTQNQINDQIKVFVDGKEATSITKTIATATTDKNAVTGANDVIQVLTLSNFEETARQSGKSYKEWSGNISLKIAKKTLTDETYSNQNLSAIDTTGTMTDIVLAGTGTENKNNTTSTSTMFTDYIKPEFTYSFSTGNINYIDKTLTVDFTVTDKYFESTILKTDTTAQNITLKLKDDETAPVNSNVTKELKYVSDVMDTVNGKSVKVGEKYKLVVKGLEQKTLNGDYKNYSGPMSISFPAGTIKDTSGNLSDAKTITIGVNEPDNTGTDKIVDVVDPMWRTDNINIDYTNKQVTVDLIGTDKYYASNSLTTDKIKVLVDGEEATSIKKTLSTASTIQYGVKYTLTLSNWEESTKQSGKQFFEWSGTTKIEIAADTLKDESNNTSNKQQFTLGHVDFIKPKIERVSSTKNASNKTETIVFNVIDKYLDVTDLVTESDISVYVDNELASQISKKLTKVSDISGTVNGVSKVVGHQYQLVLSNFEQKRTAINYNREYSDWSGNVKIKIAKDAVKDTNTPTPNKNDETEIAGEFIDFIKPNATYQYSSSNIDYNGKTFTMVFDITDKHYSSATLALSDLTIRIDGEEPNWDDTGVHGVIKQLTIIDRTNTVNGQTQTIGKRYTLKLSHLEQLEKLAGKETMDYSGVITVAIPKDKVADTSGNKNDALTITSGIEVKGETGKGEIGLPANNTVMAIGTNPGGSSASGSFANMNVYALEISNETGIIGKYDATNNTGNGHSNSTTTWKDLNGSNNGTINGAIWGNNYLKFDGVNDWVNLGQMSFTNYASLDITMSIDKVQSGEVDLVSNFEDGGIGIYLMNGVPRFSIYSKNLNKYIEISADTALTVGEKTNIKGIYDGNNLYLYINGNPVTGTVVDVVDPIWERVSSSASAANQTATITVRGTDKYFASSALTADKIKILINGKEVSTNVSVNVGTATPVYSADGTTRIGDQYTITLSGSGLPKDTNQIKVQIQECALTDTSGNKNKATDLIVFNALAKTDTETSATSGFLGSASSANTKVKTIQRQNIDNVTFVDNIPSTVYDKSAQAYVDDKAWDVSAMQDKSILAWYTTNANGSLKVYIGSDYEIFGNYDSSNLFTYIGSASICTSTETISKIELLNVASVTNMFRMFRYTGANAMTILNLGNNFDTSNVKIMEAMFGNTGSNAMTTLDLGNKFDTSSVTDMIWMFASTGYTAMTSLDLGEKFNTRNVTDMNNMFNSTGYTAMTTLNLGGNFNTSKVTDMQYMFNQTGYTAMTSLDLGTKFNTSNVTTMKAMFKNTGKAAMKTLNLGANFDTSKVTNMFEMFYRTGYNQMSSLDLGTKFNTINVTNMSYMFFETGPVKLSSINLGTEFDTRNVTDMSHMFHNIGNNDTLKNLDLGDKFYTTSATNMDMMFYGTRSLESLDLGPAFTKVATQHDDMFGGTTANTTIYAPEQIYLDKNNFKLNTDATSSAINYTRGTINPRYRTEWINENSKITIDTANPKNSKITITLRGRTSAEAGVDFTSNVTSLLTQAKLNDQIQIFIDGEQVDGLTKTIGDATVVKNAVTGANDVTQVLTLSNFEESARQSGKNFKEWSGNIILKIDKKTLKDDKYGNQNLNAIDTTGTMQDIVMQGTGTETSNNTTSTTTMFTDYIKPEFTYEYANTQIDYDKKTVTVVFDVTDKYFKQSTVSLDNTTIKVDGKDVDWTKVNKTLAKKKTNADQKVGEIVYKTDGTIWYPVNGKLQQIGERYELIVSGLETKNGEGYSGTMTLAFPSGIVTDQSNNSNSAKTITLGIDDPENHGDHKDPIVVDVVNPLWSYGTSSINRVRNGATADTVDLTIIGSDKYYKANTLTEDKIKVYVDDKLQVSITKKLTQITDTATLKKLATKQGLADINNLKFTGYKLTLGNFGTINGVTKIVIDAGTIQDESGNKNIETTINVGNIEWIENGDSSTNQKYPAFRNSIVDFIKPVIKYKYSAVEGARNPDIDYEARTLTVKFTVTDKYLRESTIIKADGTLNTDAVKIKVAGTDLTTQLHTVITSADITDGKEYTLVISNFELVYNTGKGYEDYSGEVQLVFEANKIDDTSGNKNDATTITIDTDDGDDPDHSIIVDVIDPLIEKTKDSLSVRNAQNNIVRDLNTETGVVSVEIRATDKYLKSGTLENVAEQIKVMMIKPGTTEKVEVPTIKKTVTKLRQQATLIDYKITLSNFERNEGITSIVIPKGVIKDTSENGNKETELLVGNATWVEVGDSKGEYTAFRDSIIDVTRPTWNYATSSITRDRDGETGTVTIKILGKDTYYLKDTLTTNDISVYVANSENPEEPITTITKTLTKITDTAQLEGADTGYTLTLGNFGKYDGKVKIKIDADTIKDTSGNGNKETEISVGNSKWVETDVGDSSTNPKYTAFRNSIVDFIKPIIIYQYEDGVNPVIDRDNKKVSISFNVTDTNFLESNITASDIRVLVDDMEVTDSITKKLEKSDIKDTTDTNKKNGVKYTLTLSNFELDQNLEDEIFRRHSGKIELIIAKDKVRDTSGNGNIETSIIVDNDNGDDENNFINVDFVKPKIFYDSKFISWDNRYAEVTIKGTDRFYDFNTKLEPEDIKLYQQNDNGDYIEVTNLPVTIKSVKNKYGYDFVIRLGEFEEEYKMKIVIAAGKISDSSGNVNEETEIIVGLDNKKPIWKYISTDTSKFETDGKISFTVKGQDKFLNLTKSGLQDSNMKIYKDGVELTDSVGITVNYLGQDTTEKSKSYKIDITGLKEIGSYSLVFEEKTLIDEFDNESNATTISFSKSAISSNTNNYTAVTYHASHDFELMHQAYVHELMSVNKTGKNSESKTYRASSVGEIYKNVGNTTFAEPFTYTNGTQSAYSFKGWGVANENGHLVDDQGTILTDESKATIYGLYDEIPETVTNLKAIWQKATVIFVSKNGNNANNGFSPETPVKDIKTAYSKLSASGTMKTNVIVIMDAIEWNSSDVLTGNATITSLYAGVDYTNKGAELKISSNMQINGNVMYDDIKLYSNSTTVSDGSDYLANGSYNNMLITNYGNVVLGRGIITPNGKYTFGAVIGGEYRQETKTGSIGIHTVIVEAGKYNDIVIGSALGSGGQSIKPKYVSHQITIGTMKEAAISRNSRVTITGYLSMGELEDRCYPYKTSGNQETSSSYSRTYSITRLYSATFTGENKFAKASEDASIYLRSANGFNDGKTDFEMYGGNVTGNVYAGARMATDSPETTLNAMKFYGGTITGNIFGQGGKDSSYGGTEITLEGIFTMTGDIFGGSNSTTVGSGKVNGSSTILLNSTSSVVTGNVYGGSNGIINNGSINLNNGLITGSSSIKLNAGKVTGDIYGGGNNCGIVNTADITINNGTVLGTIYGGAYQNQVQGRSAIKVYGGTVNDIYGGNILTGVSQQMGDTTNQEIKITIGDENATTTPTVKGDIYGGGKFDKIENSVIQLIKCSTKPTVYGGSYSSGVTNKSSIYLMGMTVSTIYGGSNVGGNVTSANIYLQSGTVTDVYGGGYGGKGTEAGITLEGTATVTSIYGGSNTKGDVETTKVILKSGTITNVFGGGNSAPVRNANVTLNGAKLVIDSIHGGSKKTGLCNATNVNLEAGTVTNVYGGGLDIGSTNATVNQKGAKVTNIYGGNHGGTGDGGQTTNAIVNIVDSSVKNVYGGNYGRGTTQNTTINISGISVITGELYGGGFRSAIGTAEETGSTTINITGGSINKDINGGSKESKVYGTTNVNIGRDAVADKDLTAASINIRGNIYAGGDSYKASNRQSQKDYDFDTISVYGDTHATLDNSTQSTISFSGSIFGAGNAASYSNEVDGSTITVKDFGSSTESYRMTSIERTGKVYIDHSYLELVGEQDVNNYYKTTRYTLNRISNGLTLQNGTTLYTQRGFNLVNGFESVKTDGDGTSTKQTVSIADGAVTRNVDNRIYTLEGINLVFAKQEGDIYSNSSQDIWGDVNGMAFFGMYRINRQTGGKDFDIYDPNYSGGGVEGFFANGTYIEGRHKSNHDTTVDGFYTNVGDYSNPNNVTVTPEIIEVTDYGTYYDWIAGGDVVNYSTTLIASTYSTYSMSELLLDYKYKPNATYNVNRVSINALNPDINLINPLDIPTISSNANNTFGLTISTDRTGWVKSGTTTILSEDYGKIGGTTYYKTDSTSTPGKLIFKIYNSMNVSEDQDLGNVNIVLTGKTTTGKDTTQGGVFKVVISVTLQSIYEEDKEQYTPSFTNSTETELNYTTDSKVDLTYLLYKNAKETIYTSEDYRVLSSTVKLTAGTKLTMRDYGQGDTVNKVYYYQVPSDSDYESTETVDGKTRYIYKLSKFIDMGSTSVGTKYADNNSIYYHDGYVFEKYDISIDFRNSNINANQLAQETYLELRNSAGQLKYDNGDKDIKYNLYNRNATMSETISNESRSYSAVENLDIPFTLNTVLQEQEVSSGVNIRDTKYEGKIAGIAIEITTENGERVNAPEMQNFKLANSSDATEVYKAGDDGVIRVPLSEGLSVLQKKYTLSLTQYNVPAGNYVAKVYFFTSDDGKYYGGETKIVKEFYIAFINKIVGLVGIEAIDGSRILNKATRNNLEGNQNVDIKVRVGAPSSGTNVRVELYKRNATYTENEDGTKTYTGTEYTPVDLKTVLDGDWKTPEEAGMSNTEGATTEYVIMEKRNYATPVDEEIVQFENTLKENVSTGEYKLVFKACFDDAIIQTVRKTFIVTD